MRGAVSPDGQSIAGSVYCDSYSIDFTGSRVPAAAAPAGP